MSEFLTALQSVLGKEVKEQELLAPYTTLKIGGLADYFFNAKTQFSLVQAITTARKLHLPYFLLGGGTNILIADGGIRGLVIKNSTNQIVMKGVKGTRNQGDVSHSNVFVEADSGVPMNQLVRFTIEEGLQGLEAHLGLPGSVGGAVYMNSKWMHPEAFVGDVVHQAKILTPQNEVQDVPKSYFHFGYGTSILQTTNDIVLSVVFNLTSSSKERLWEIANESIAYRRNSQPQGIKTAGCTFKNISQADALLFKTPNYTTSVGNLIDQCGLKGKNVGDAVVSSVHANFIENKGKATAKDVIELITYIKKEVKRQFGVELKEEVLFVGEK
jgi:UDP-N-acetylenolpyruvoylglucosamine reductase